MEKKNEKPKIEELTDEQMKEVVGGADPRVIIDIMPCPPLTGCRKMDGDCNCTKCEGGYVLHLGKCVLP